MKNKYLIGQTVSALTCKDGEVEDGGTLETVVVERFSENADYFWSGDNEYLFY